VNVMKRLSNLDSEPNVECSAWRHGKVWRLGRCYVDLPRDSISPTYRHFETLHNLKYAQA
jgi:hypothetical protein